MSGSTDDTPYLVYIRNQQTQETSTAILTCHAAIALAQQKYRGQEAPPRVLLVDHTRPTPISVTTLDQLCSLLKSIIGAHQVVIIRPPPSSTILFEIHKMVQGTGETGTTHEPMMYTMYSADDNFMTLLEKALEVVDNPKRDASFSHSLSMQGGRRRRGKKHHK